MISLMKLMNICGAFFKWLQIFIYIAIVVYGVFLFCEEGILFEIYSVQVGLGLINYYALNFIRGLFDVGNLERIYRLQNTFVEYKHMGRYRIICKYGQCGVYDLLRFRYLIPLKYEDISRMGDSMYACKLAETMIVFDRKGKNIYSERLN